MKLLSLIAMCSAVLLGSAPPTHGRRLGEEAAEATSANTDGQCAPVETVKDFNLEDYVSKTWYVQYQAETAYLPEDRNFCVTANYRIIPKTWWGYTVEVNNAAQDKDGNTFGGIIAAAQVDGGKLEVAPRFLPRFLAGPYWVLAYQEEDSAAGREGYALVVGGQPTERAEGGCRTRSGGFFSGFSGGLWIFARKPTPDPAVVDEVRRMAEDEFGLDTSVLKKVQQEGCVY